jgi:hypothetical protein
MEPDKQNYGEDDGGEEDFSDVVVEDLLVGVRGVTEGFVPAGYFRGDYGFDCG